MEVGKVFGKILRQRRLTAELTQEQLAHEAGIQRNYVSLLERGVHEPTIGMILMLASALDCTAASLVDELETKLNSEK